MQRTAMTKPLSTIDKLERKLKINRDRQKQKDQYINVRVSADVKKQWLEFLEMHQLNGAELLRAMILKMLGHAVDDVDIKN